MFVLKKCLILTLGLFKLQYHLSLQNVDWWVLKRNTGTSYLSCFVVSSSWGGDREDRVPVGWGRGKKLRKLHQWQCLLPPCSCTCRGSFAGQPPSWPAAPVSTLQSLSSGRKSVYAIVHVRCVYIVLHTLQVKLKVWLCMSDCPRPPG